MFGHDGQVAAAPVGPALLIGAVELGEVAHRRDLPHAFFARVVVYEHAALDARLPGMAVEDQRLPADLRALAVGRKVQDRRIDQHRREAVCLYALVATAVAIA
jgi:hypothetical protein